MYKIYFYQDCHGREPVKEYFDELGLKSQMSKDVRIQYNKIMQYIEALKTYGLELREPYIKHIEGPIWELRPLRTRVLFFLYQEDMFILLSCFKKSTRKTPKREIEKAKQYFMDFMERRGQHG